MTPEEYAALPIPHEHILLQGTILAESPKAVQFSITHIDNEPADVDEIHWFPRSQMKEDFSVINTNVNGEDRLVVSRWIMDKKGLL
jgi:hypothetical protein